jgi:hypothetical protein
MHLHLQILFMQQGHIIQMYYKGQLTSQRGDVDVRQCSRGNPKTTIESAVPPDADALPCGPQVADQLDAIPFLCRFQYARTAEYLLRFLDPLVAAYTEAATPGALPPSQCSRRSLSPSQSTAANPCVDLEPSA